MGNYRYTVLAQGLCASQDLFNIITKGETQLDPTFKIIKNVDDFCLFGSSIKDLEDQIEKLMKMCAKINLKLAPSKFKLTNAVKGSQQFGFWKAKFIFLCSTEIVIFHENGYKF